MVGEFLGLRFCGPDQAYPARVTKAMEPARLRVSGVERSDSAERSFLDHSAF